MRRFQGLSVLVTGGTSGIGECAVRQFCAEGARVCFTGRRRDLGAAVAESVGAAAVFVPCDHADAADCARCVEEAAAALGGKIDVLFNNAGVVTLASLEDTSDALLDRVLSVNVAGVFRMCRLCLPWLLRSASGCIVNNASDWALVAAAGASLYCASKAAVVQLTKALALELAPRRVRVNAVCPGDTFVARWLHDGGREAVTAPCERIDDAEVERRLRANGDLPMGRVADVAEVVAAVLFLASPAASYVTGAALPVDGGNSCK